MKIIVSFICHSFLLFLLTLPGISQDRAILKKDSDTKYHVEVIIEVPAITASPIVAAIYIVDSQGKRKQVQKFPGPLPPQNAPQKTVFSIDMPSPPKDDDSFIVSVFELPTIEGNLHYELPVTKALASSISSSSSQCPGGLLIRLDSREYTLADWMGVSKWIQQHNRSPQTLAMVEIVTATAKTLYPIHTARALTLPERAAQTGTMLLCLDLEPNLPVNDFNATITFHNPPTDDLRQPVLATGLTGAPIPPTPTSADDNGVPGQRGLERNLDFGITLSSSVDEVEDMNMKKVVKRATQGTFDIRIAPWLNVEPYKRFNRNQKLFRYFTPIYVDAAISTGSITKDTLSTNRVIIGTEYEWRLYNFKKDPATGDTITTPYTTFHR